jgi:hypothetical protein
MLGVAWGILGWCSGYEGVTRGGWTTLERLRRCKGYFGEQFPLRERLNRHVDARTIFGVRW